MELTVPGDKSITQRALILATLAVGESILRDPSTGADSMSTASVLRALGADISFRDNAREDLRIQGLGLRGLSAPSEPLDFENSGTGARLMMGVLAAQPISAILTGDASLQSRPMRRITQPLKAMGGTLMEVGEVDRLPIEVRGGALHSCSYDSPVASAQVKSSLLFAGLVAGVPLNLTEPVQSRDHTERMFTSLGVDVRAFVDGALWRVELRDPPSSIPAMELRVPGDFSSAAFLIALAVMGGCPAPLILQNVGLNPTRTGLLSVLRRMGAMVKADEPPPAKGTEPVGSIEAKASTLCGLVVSGEEIPSLIDEIPIIAVLASRAQGETRITGAGELRVKESDRIAALVTNLRAVGVDAEELSDGLVVHGGDHPLMGTIDSFHDHRIAMAFGVLGALPGNTITVLGMDTAEVSFPGFWKLLDRITRQADGTSATPPRSEGAADGGAVGPWVVTIDGPAGSGKSTTAREVAQRLGYRHLDSGALYRAIAYALLDAHIPEEEWAALPAQRLDALGIEAEPDGDRVRITLSGRVLNTELRSSEATRCSPIVAKLPAVREWLLSIQRSLGARGGLVADGRDMGSVVFPTAAVKVYLKADLIERARRRIVQDGNPSPTHEQVQAEATRIQDRDEQDAGREQSPLVIPEGARILDTTNLDFEEQVGTIVDMVRRLTPH